MKWWIHLQKAVAKMKLRISFLIECIKQQVTPPHLKRFSNYEINLHHQKSRAKYYSLFNGFIRRMLKNEICDAYRHIRALKVNILTCARSISLYVPTSICNAFFAKQNNALRYHYTAENKRLDRKFSWLLEKHKRKLIENIRSIRYYGTISTSVSPNKQSQRKLLRSNAGEPKKINNNVSFSSQPLPRSPPSSFLQTFEISL